MLLTGSGLILQIPKEIPVQIPSRQKVLIRKIPRVPETIPKKNRPIIPSVMTGQMMERMQILSGKTSRIFIFPKGMVTVLEGLISWNLLL